MVDSLTMFFGKRKRRGRRSPGRRPKRGHGVRKLRKNAFVRVGNRKRKLHKGKNGALYYRTRSGKTYVPNRVLRSKGHYLSPRRGRRSRRRRRRRSPKRRRRRGRKSRRRGRRKKLKKSKAARKARAYYRKNRAKILRAARRRRRRGAFGWSWF